MYSSIIKYSMTHEELIAYGNNYREQNQPNMSLQLYLQALLQDSNSVNAFNNFGNVAREIGYPDLAIPFLKRAIALDPNHITARFNLAVCYLQQGDYAQGWPLYETRWQYEHLAGTLPQFDRPRWTGQDLKDKTILVIGEQGHGDNIQFVRFAIDLQNQGARVLLQVTDGMIPLLSGSSALDWCGGYQDQPPPFDYWTPIMSIPGQLGITLDRIPQHLSYLSPNQNYINKWQAILGTKTRMRVGLCWSGRRDTWLNQHKSLPFDQVVELIKQNPDYEWINLQIDATDEESQQLAQLGVRMFPGTIEHFHDTAGLLYHMDVVVGVDTAVSHLSAAGGRPTWIMLNQFAPCWRWMLDRDDSPWYPSVKLFRQPSQGDWSTVIKNVTRWLKLFKI